MTIKVSYYPNKQVNKVRYFNSDGDHHREDGPAQLWYQENGKIYQEIYQKNGQLHREDGPAVIYYEEDGTSIHHIQHWIDGKAHKEDGPAFITYMDGEKSMEGYWKNGVLEKSVDYGSLAAKE